MRGWFVAALLPLLLAGCQTAAPTPPSPELAYCEKLFASVERYMLPKGFNERRDPEADMAVDLCRRGRTQEGIPILETKLQRAQWPLPQR